MIPESDEEYAAKQRRELEKYNLDAVIDAAIHGDEVEVRDLMLAGERREESKNQSVFI